jgi:hypothetical protein
MEKKKTFKELFAGTGIEPTTDENGGVHYNFNATLKKPTTPIELPSDEEMGVIALNIASTLKDGLDSREEAFYLAGFQTCAKWIKELILNQNK